MATSSRQTMIVFLGGVFIAGLWAAPGVASSPGKSAESAGLSASLSLGSTDALIENHAWNRSLHAATTAWSQESTEGSTSEAGEGWSLDGPYFLRSADPLEAGEIELKFIYGYEKEPDDEEHEIEFVFEWGLAEGHEFILEVPVTLGEGKVEGNGDIMEFGFHSRIWDEADWLPAFSVRNLIRIPTGHRSNGVDYLLRGLFTTTLETGTTRLHFNPFAKWVNGNLDDDERHFQWGAAIGFDYRISDDLLLIADYMHRSSEAEGVGNQQSVELGADWEFADDQILAFQAEFEVDGDSQGADFGVRIAYILELEGPRIDE